MVLCDIRCKLLLVSVEAVNTLWIVTGCESSGELHHRSLSLSESPNQVRGISKIALHEKQKPVLPLSCVCVCMCVCVSVIVGVTTSPNLLDVVVFWHSFLRDSVFWLQLCLKFLCEILFWHWVQETADCYNTDGAITLFITVVSCCADVQDLLKQPKIVCCETDPNWVTKTRFALQVVQSENVPHRCRHVRKSIFLACQFILISQQYASSKASFLFSSDLGGFSLDWADSIVWQGESCWEEGTTSTKAPSVVLISTRPDVTTVNALFSVSMSLSSQTRTGTAWTMAPCNVLFKKAPHGWTNFVSNTQIQSKHKTECVQI